MQKKKLQVFVSSTYSDLLEERQAAVQAILTAGHIPAGMELFAAGDQSQLEVIRRWIAECDAFVLLLGGRYGSVEPTSGKSYTQLEYEHALALKKPLFAVVMEADQLEAKVKAVGSKVLETERPAELRVFRDMVLSRIVRFWRDPRDIKLAILETLADYERQDGLIGWVRGDSVNVGALAEEIARVGRENSELRSQLNAAKAALPNEATYNGLTFDQMYDLLAQSPVDVSKLDDATQQMLKTTCEHFGDDNIALIHEFWSLHTSLLRGLSLKTPALDAARALGDFGLVEPVFGLLDGWRFTSSGHQFWLALKVKRGRR